MDNAKPLPGVANIRELDAQVAGVPLVIEVSAGPSASQADLAAADAIVASIRLSASPVPSVTPSVVPTPGFPAPAFARYFFKAPDDTGVLEVSSSPSSVCYSTQSAPPRPIDVVSQPIDHMPHVELSFTPTTSGTYCDDTVHEALVRDLIDHPESYRIVWRPQEQDAQTNSRLTPQG
jgi:hypothetical protein